MKVTIVGASGKIGREIDKALSNNHEIVRVGATSGDVQCSNGAIHETTSSLTINHPSSSATSRRGRWVSLTRSRPSYGDSFPFFHGLCPRYFKFLIPIRSDRVTVRFEAIH